MPARLWRRLYSNLFHQAFANTTTIRDNTIAAKITNPHTNKALFFSDNLFFFDNKIEGTNTKKNKNGSIDESSLAPLFGEPDRLPKTKNCKSKNTTWKTIKTVSI